MKYFSFMPIQLTSFLFSKTCSSYLLYKLTNWLIILYNDNNYFLRCGILILFIFKLLVFFTDNETNTMSQNTFSYVQDPCANIKTGFGYLASSKHKNGSTISFVKGETINVQNQKSDKNNVVTRQQKDLVKKCDIKNGNRRFKLRELFYIFFMEISYL